MLAAARFDETPLLLALPAHCIARRVLRLQPPPNYAYFIGDGGHTTSRVTILAINDEEPKERAKQLVDGHAVELWQVRKIAIFDPEQGMMPS